MKDDYYCYNNNNNETTLEEMSMEQPVKQHMLTILRTKCQRLFIFSFETRLCILYDKSVL